VRIGCLLYVLAIVLAAAIRRRDGAIVYLVGMTVFFSAMMYVDLVTNGFLPRTAISIDAMPLGMLVMLFSQIVIMAERWARARGCRQLVVATRITARARTPVLRSRGVRGLEDLVLPDQAARLRSRRACPILSRAIRSGELLADPRHLRRPRAAAQSEPG